MTTAMIVELDEAELVVRMIEAMTGLPRSKGVSPAQALEAVSRQPGGLRTAKTVQRAANAAMLYFRECCDQGKPVS